MAKSGHEMGALSEEEYVKVHSLLDECKKVEAFEFDGILFLGETTEVVKRYVKLSPSKKFFIWLQDNVTMLTPSE